MQSSCSVPEFAILVRSGGEQRRHVDCDARLVVFFSTITVAFAVFMVISYMRNLHGFNVDTGVGLNQTNNSKSYDPFLHLIIFLTHNA